MNQKNKNCKIFKITRDISKKKTWKNRENRTLNETSWWTRCPLTAVKRYVGKPKSDLFFSYLFCYLMDNSLCHIFKYIVYNRSELGLLAPLGSSRSVICFFTKNQTGSRSPTWVHCKLKESQFTCLMTFDGSDRSVSWPKKNWRGQVRIFKGGEERHIRWKK